MRAVVFLAGVIPVTLTPATVATLTNVRDRGRWRRRARWIHLVASGLVRARTIADPLWIDKPWTLTERGENALLAAKGP